MVEHYWMRPNNGVISIQSAPLEMLICFLPCSSHMSISDQSYQEPNKWNPECTNSPNKQLWIIDWSGFLTQGNVFLLRQLIGLCYPSSRGRRHLREAAIFLCFSVMSEKLGAAVHQPNDTNKLKMKSMAHKMPECCCCCCILSQCHRMKRDVSYMADAYFSDRAAGVTRDPQPLSLFVVQRGCAGVFKKKTDHRLRATEQAELMLKRAWKDDS